MIHIELGDLGINIPTDVALENITDVTLKPYSHFLINVRTLIRNTVSSVGSVDDLVSVADDILTQIIHDMDFLNTYIKGVLETEVVFYVNTYKKITYRSEFKEAILKTPNTTKQLTYAELEMRIIEKLIANGAKIKFTDDCLHGENNSVIVITHVLLDLIDHSSFSNCVLLESHTGALKRYYQWGDKLVSNKEWRGRIPFNTLTLNVFGDGQVIKGLGIKVRKRYFELATKSKWNGSTSRTRVLFVINENKADKEMFGAYI